MKHLLITTIAAVVLVGCGPSEAELALMDAARGGDIEAVKHHLAAGVDVNAIYEGQTPLHLAATYGTPSIANQRKEIVELLIAAGADVNAKEADNGSTPLHHAASGGHKEIVELLIASGADVNAKNIFDKTPLDWAKGETADILRKHGGKTIYELSIWKAAFGGSIEAVKQHIAAGTDVNAKDTHGWTPLNHATEGGHKEVVELLIANGADVNAKNRAARYQRYQGYAPLGTAILNDETEIAELLIAKGADVNTKADGGWTPLHSAVNKEVAELLIAAGADLNAKDDDGWIPMHSAAILGHKEVVELLIAKGADVNAKDDDGKTPLDQAIKWKRTETAALLRKHGGKTGAELKADGK